MVESVKVREKTVKREKATWIDDWTVILVPVDWTATCTPTWVPPRHLTCHVTKSVTVC